MGKAHQARRRAAINVGSIALLGLGLLGSAAPLHIGSTALVQARPARMAMPLLPESVSPASNARATLDRLPMIFEAARGKSVPGVRFLSRGNGYALYLTDTDAILVAGAGSAARPGANAANKGPATLRFHFEGANAHPSVSGVDPQQTTTNYFIGSDVKQWRTGVPAYGRVAYQNVYPGISLLYYGTRGRLEYDFRVAAHVHPGSIRLAIAGDTGLSLDAQGNLDVASSAGTIVEARPTVYQMIGGRRQMVAGNYVLLGGHRVGFSIGTYDARYPLVIDPVLSYSDLFGSNTTVTGVALDRSRDVYFAGTTYTIIMSTTASYMALTSTQPPLRPVLPASEAAPIAYLAKLNSSGTKLLFDTYIGGNSDAHGLASNPSDTNGYNYATGLAVDAAGFAYLTGYSDATNFPTTVGGYRGSNAGGFDAFLVKVAPGGGDLVYSTLLGGTTDNSGRWGDDVATGVAVDHAGEAYITGYTYTYNFPVKGGLAGKLGYGKGTLGGQEDAFVTKFSRDGSSLIYSTYLGGSGADSASAIALDPSGDAYVAGQTSSPDFPTPPHALQPALPASGTSAFVAKLNRSGNALVYATYLGQSSADVIHSIAVDVSGNAYIVGETNGGVPQTAAFAQPTSGGGTDAFISKISARGVLTYSTFLGGAGNDVAYSVAVDGRGNAYVAGSTGSAEFNTPKFPIKGQLQGQLGGNRGGFGMLDAFVTKINSCGSGLLYSSYFGGTFVDSATAIAVDGGGNAYVGGTTLSPNFPFVHSLLYASVYRPTTANAFIAKISGAQEQPFNSCPIPLTYALSATQLSVAGSVPLTVTVHTAPFAKVTLGLTVQNTVPPPPPPTPVPVPTPLPGHKPVKVKPPTLPHYPKVGEIIYRLHATGTADAYGLYVGTVHPKLTLTIAEPATLTIAVTGSHSTVKNSAAVTVGP